MYLQPVGYKSPYGKVVGAGEPSSPPPPTPPNSPVINDVVNTTSYAPSPNLNITVTYPENATWGIAIKIGTSETPDFETAQTVYNDLGGPGFSGGDPVITDTGGLEYFTPYYVYTWAYLDDTGSSLSTPNVSSPVTTLDTPPSPNPYPNSLACDFYDWDPNVGFTFFWQASYDPAWALTVTDQGAIELLSYGENGGSGYDTGYLTTLDYAVGIYIVTHQSLPVTTNADWGTCDFYESTSASFTTPESYAGDTNQSFATAFDLGTLYGTINYVGFHSTQAEGGGNFFVFTTEGNDTVDLTITDNFTISSPEQTAGTIQVFAADQTTILAEASGQVTFNTSSDTLYYIKITNDKSSQLYGYLTFTYAEV